MPAVLLFVVALPLVLGVIPRNRLYGMRTPRTLSDDRVWYRVNRVAGLALVVSSGVYGAVAAIRPYDRLAANNFAIWSIHLAAFVVPVVMSLRLATQYAKRLCPRGAGTMRDQGHGSQEAED
jgi:uncharacterized membrane protein